MAATVFSEALHPLAFLVSEEGHGFLSRDAVTIAASQTIVVGQVLGAVGVVASETATVTAAAGNVGDGTVTMDATAPIRSDAMDGVYTVEFISTGATAAFNLLDPNGLLVGTGAVGTGFVGPLKFSIADDASHHYTLADRIYITVSRPITAQQFKAWSPTATDGSQVAVAIAGYPATTGASETKQITAIARNAEVRKSDLTFAAGATAAQIADAVIQLDRKRIICR